MSASGGTAPYTWSATGLPAGLAINASSGLISGTPTTAGTYNVTADLGDRSSASASGSAACLPGRSTAPGGRLHPAPDRSWATPASRPAPPPRWSASAGVIDSSTGQAAHSGSWYAWMNGYGTTHTDTLTQSVTIPTGCTATFSFWLHIDTAETTTTTAYDKLTVKAGSTTLATYSNLNKNTGYAQKSFNVSSLPARPSPSASPASRTPHCKPPSSSTTPRSPPANRARSGTSDHRNSKQVRARHPPGAWPELCSVPRDPESGRRT